MWCRGDVRYRDGTKLKPKHVVKYLGCHLNDKADATRELAKRMSACFLILKKVGPLLAALGLLGSAKHLYV